jgi:GNAT superfamily N-acetyltransferase
MDAPGSSHAPTPEIRLAQPGDAAFIVSLTARFAGAGAPRWHDPARLAIFFERGIGEIAEAVAANRVPQDEAILIATVAEQPLGFIHLRSELSGLTLEPQGYINALATTAEAEGQGIGRTLLTAGENWARRRGFRVLALETFGGNRHARDFYARGGYEEETLKLTKRL